MHNVQNEFIAEVFLEMQTDEDDDWRKESGLLVSNKRMVSSSITDRIWGKEGFRVFLSHKTEVKKETASLKDELGIYGISGFVAHEDIHPTKEWQAEIENALSSMDALVALMTNDFHDSLWTDQEVGFALGRGVPIISVKLELDPYGLIGKYQALQCAWDSAAIEIVKILITHESMKNSYIKAVRNCPNYECGNKLGGLLPSINNLNDRQVKDLIEAFNENVQVRDSFGFDGAKPRLFGKGLLHHLTRLTGKNYKLSDEGEITV
jgi:hypothetical protein